MEENYLGGPLRGQPLESLQEECPGKIVWITRRQQLLPDDDRERFQIKLWAQSKQTAIESVPRMLAQGELAESSAVLQQVIRFDLSAHQKSELCLQVTTVANEPIERSSSLRGAHQDAPERVRLGPTLCHVAGRTGFVDVSQVHVRPPADRES
jgi:hypothetical protein